jgi:hypothetical protein
VGSAFMVLGELLLRQLEFPERSRRNELGPRGKRRKRNLRTAWVFQDA